jgi:hypothetical protein
MNCLSSDCRKSPDGYRLSASYPMHRIAEFIDERINPKVLLERVTPALARRLGAWVLTEKSKHGVSRFRTSDLGTLITERNTRSKLLNWLSASQIAQQRIKLLIGTGHLDATSGSQHRVDVVSNPLALRIILVVPTALLIQPFQNPQSARPLQVLRYQWEYYAVCEKSRE